MYIAIVCGSPKDREAVLMSAVLNEAFPTLKEKDFDVKFEAYQTYLKETKAFWPEESDEPVYVLEGTNPRVTGDYSSPQSVYVGEWVYEDDTIIRDQKMFKIMLSEKERQDLVEGINQWYVGLTDKLQKLKRKKGALTTNRSIPLKRAEEKCARAKRAVDDYAGGSTEEIAELNRLKRNAKQEVIDLSSEDPEIEEIDMETAEIRTRLGRLLS